MSGRRLALARALWLLLGVLWLTMAGPQATAQTSAQAPVPVSLAADGAAVSLWPAVRVLRDEAGMRSVQQALAARGEFLPPSGAYSTLGVMRGAVWLRVPVVTGANDAGEWVFDVDYPPLQKLDVYLLQGERVVADWQLGSLRPFASRPMQGRGHAVPMQLAASERYEVLVRAESNGALIMPMTLSRLSNWQGQSSREQMLQGVLIGIALMLLAYSLIQWVILREAQFLSYGVLVFGSLLFSLLQFGGGAQFVWTDRPWVQHHMAGIAALTATLGSFLFFAQSLHTAAPTPRWFQRTMHGGAALCAVLLVVYCSDLFDNRVLTAIVTLLGLAPATIALVIAVRRALQGDRIGIALMLSWLVFTTGTVIINGVIRGTQDATFWSMHAFQFGATVDMLVFMYILGHRTRAIRMEAARTRHEKELLLSLAYTDALTGLANRRGLGDALGEAVSVAKIDSMVGLFVLDLDRFKPVNDRYGHDVGDDLLRIEANRLRSAVRAGDTVARTGGDEFVVVARALPGEQEADEIARKLVSELSQPVSLAAVPDGPVTVGVTVGYALAPTQAMDPHALMLIADRAMYEGKKGGRNRAVKAVQLA